MKDRRQNHLEGHRWPAAAREDRVMPANAGLDRTQVNLGVFSHSSEHVISGLRIVDSARQALEAEKTHGLLVKFVQRCAAKLAGRFQHGCTGKLNWGDLLQPLHQQTESERRRVGRHHRRSEQIRRNHF